MRRIKLLAGRRGLPGIRAASAPSRSRFPITKNPQTGRLSRSKVPGNRRLRILGWRSLQLPP